MDRACQLVVFAMLVNAEQSSLRDAFSLKLKPGERKNAAAARAAAEGAASVFNLAGDFAPLHPP